jgi:hypothetical protein
MNPTSPSRWTGPVLTAVVALLLSLGGCGGGGANLADGGIVGTGAAGQATQGTITAVGNHSIVVSGQTFATTGATVTVNGSAASDSALAVGMVVTVLSTLQPNGSMSVTSIDYHAEIQGVVTGVDLTAQTFTVLGQLVQTNSATLYSGGTFDTLLNQVVDVSGFRADPGYVLATLIIIYPAANPATAPLQVTGTVASLNTTQRTFAIGSQPVDYSGIAVTSVPAGLVNGVTARVTGTQPSPVATVAAQTVAIVTPTPPDVTHVELEGVVTNFGSVASFQVNGQSIDASGAAIEDGTPSMIADGALVDVKGNIVGGILVASKLEIEHSPVIELDGVAQTVDAVGGSVTVSGQVAHVTSSTQFIDSSAAAVGNFSLASVQVGDRLSILAFPSQNGLVATRVERLNPDAPAPGQPTTTIQGVISNFTSVSNFMVAGQQVNARAATFVGGEAKNLADGVNVSVAGTLANGVLNASAVQFLGGNPPPSAVTISGTISNFVSVGDFVVAGQRVDASSANFNNGTASNLANGRTVTVKGVIQGATLVAQSVTFAQTPPTTLQVEGQISNFVSASSFVVAGQPVNASQATFSGGKASDLADGVKVQVQGTLQNGVLVASTVQIETSSSGSQEVEVEGLITNFVSVSNFTVAGRVIDASNAKFSDGTAADLANGKNVQVHGMLNGQVVTATEVEFDD